MEQSQLMESLVLLFGEVTLRRMEKLQVPRQHLAQVLSKFGYVKVKKYIDAALDNRSVHDEYDKPITTG